MSSIEEILARYGIDPTLASEVESEQGIPPAPVSPEVLSERGAAVLRRAGVPEALINACIQDSLDGSISGFEPEEAEEARERSERREARAEHRRNYMRDYMRERRSNGTNPQ